MYNFFSKGRPKAAERIKMLFGVNTLGAYGTLCYTRGPDPFTNRGRGLTFKFWDPSYLRNSWSHRDLKFCTQRATGLNENYAKVGHRWPGSGLVTYFQIWGSETLYMEHWCVRWLVKSAVLWLFSYIRCTDIMAVACRLLRNALLCKNYLSRRHRQFYRLLVVCIKDWREIELVFQRSQCCNVFESHQSDCMVELAYRSTCIYRVGQKTAHFHLLDVKLI